MKSTKIGQIVEGERKWPNLTWPMQTAEGYISENSTIIFDAVKKTTKLTTWSGKTPLSNKTTIWIFLSFFQFLVFSFCLMFHFNLISWCIYQNQTKPQKKFFWVILGQLFVQRLHLTLIASRFISFSIRPGQGGSRWSAPCARGSTTTPTKWSWTNWSGALLTRRSRGRCWPPPTPSEPWLSYFHWDN